MAEHAAAVRRNDASSQVTAHSTRSGHTFKFDEAKILARGDNRVSRELLKSWFTGPLSISKFNDLPTPYSVLKLRLGGVTSPAGRAEVNTLPNTGVVFGSTKLIRVNSASRLQRWATILFGYDFHIRYCRNTEFGQADTLTGLISNQQEPPKDIAIAAISIEDDLRRQLSDAIRGIPVTSADIRRATEKDPVLHRPITYVQTCWPATTLAGDLRQLLLRQASLFVVDSSLMFADRVVIPSSLRPTVLRQFHAAHPGARLMKPIACSFAYWPGIDGDIDDLVRRCYRC
nr:unnamed protein product [Spirometra erinaceieuropaei]